MKMQDFKTQDTRVDEGRDAPAILSSLASWVSRSCVFP